MSSIAMKRGAAPPRQKRKTAPSRPQPMVALPVERSRLIRNVAIAFTGLAAAAGLTLAGLAGVPQRLWQDIVIATAAAGFEISHVEVSGTRELPRLAVYEAALSGDNNAMLAVDLADIRARLLTIGWVQDASVGRRLPDTLVVHITERKPVALWQYQRRLAAVDISGRPLTRKGLERFDDLPLVVGKGANARVREAMQLIAATPLGRDVDAAILVGGRRWDLRFKTGETLALPDQPAEAASALRRFAKLDASGSERLIGGRFSRFDMRLPGRMIVAGPGVQSALDAAAKAAKAQVKPTTI